MYCIIQNVVIFVPSNTNNMTAIADTKENNLIVKALKSVADTKWVGNTTHDNLYKCLVAINLESNNGGFYQPTATRINGLTGIFMINKNGSIFWEARVIKKSETSYRIEYLTSEGYSHFENTYNQISAEVY